MFDLLKKLLGGKPTAPRSAERPTTPKVTVTMSFGVRSSRSSAGDSGPLTAKGTAWVLNPRSTFPVTVSGISEARAGELKAILDDPTVRYGASRDRLLEFLARWNVKWLELEGELEPIRARYLRVIDQLKASSPEWAAVGDLDRQDLLDGFRRQASDEADLGAMMRPHVSELAEGGGGDVTIDDALIDRFGFEAIQVYVARADKLAKVHRIEATNYARAAFEALVANGLARRGQDIPIADVLAGLTLKELNALAPEAAKPFGRKAKAVEYLETLPDVWDRLKNSVAFREQFQLCPLPPEFSRIDLAAVASGWRRVRAEADLMAHTYLFGNSAFSQVASGREYAKGWEIIATDNSCSACKLAAEKKYTKSRPPQVPMHVGCRCAIVPTVD